MPTRYQLIAALILTAMTIAGNAHPQSAFEQRKLQQQQQAIEGKNPLLPKRTQVSFSGSGSATFTPRKPIGDQAPDPNCTPAVTAVGFNLQCLSDPDVKSASTCRGTLSFYGFNATRNVTGEVTASASDAFSMRLNASDDSVQGCEITNVAPVSASLGNVIAMPGCGLNLAGCAGEAVGSGANRALTSSGSVILAPSD